MRRPIRAGSRIRPVRFVAGLAAAVVAATVVLGAVAVGRRVIDVDRSTPPLENGNCYAEVIDRAGNTIECGHNRPPEIDEMWRRSRTTPAADLDHVS